MCIKDSFAKHKIKSSLTILLSSSSLPPRKHSLKYYYNNISLPWAFIFFYQSTSFASPNTKLVWTISVDNKGLKICLLGTSNFVVTLSFFPRCKPKWSRDGSIDNHKFYMVHGPWCKHPLKLLVLQLNRFLIGCHH